MGTEIVQSKSALPAEYAGYEEHEGVGNEEVKATDIALPFLAIAQSNSPQVKKQESAYIQGISEGDMFHTITSKMYPGGDQGIKIINCYFQHRYVEWVPRNKGGGFVKQYLPGEQPRIETVEVEGKKRDVLPNGNDLVNTHYHFCLIVDLDGKDYEQIVIAMSSTQMKKSTRWNSKILNLKLMTADGSKRFTPPRFAMLWNLMTEYEKNEKGSWYGYKIEANHFLNLQDAFEASVFKAAAEFSALMREKQVEITPPSRDQEDTGNQPAPHSQGENGSEEEIPF
jgi:hypothetical protein